MKSHYCAGSLPRSKEFIFVGGLAASLLSGCAAPTRAPGSYIGVSVGRSRWDATSNKYQLESDSEPGIAGAVDFGRLWSHGRYGLELSGRENDIHGVNGHAVRNPNGTCLSRTKGNGRCTMNANGNKLDVFGLQALGTYEPFRWHGLRPYIFGGAGAALLWARSVDVPEGDRKVNGAGVGPSAQIGAGIAYHVTSRIEIDAGYRALWIAPTKVDGLSTHYVSHGVMLSARVRLGGDGD